MLGSGATWPATASALLPDRKKRLIQDGKLNMSPPSWLILPNCADRLAPASWRTAQRLLLAIGMGAGGRIKQAIGELPNGQVKLRSDHRGAEIGLPGREDPHLRKRLTTCGSAA
jgi:hypothetical protein